jgi:6-phosphogluconolactonase (cycloisomerase 2 family)
MLLRGLATLALGMSLSACSGGGGGGGNGPGTFSMGGTVSGLASGASVVLVNNGGNATTVSANGGFTFPTAVAGGSAYAVTVQTQPTDQICTVTNGSGTASATVGNVTVACVTNATNTFTTGGTVSGLASGASVALRNNGGNDLTVSANGAFTFTTPLATGGAYAVTVLTPPTGQTCTVANDSGTIASANVTNVAVTCVVNPTPTFTIGGTVSGLAGTGLVLRNNGGNNLTIAANGTFTFTSAIATGGAYAVTVLSQPTGQTCTAANGSGTIASANVTNVAVTCVINLTPTFSIGGTVSGLAGSGLVLHNNGSNLAVSANGSFTFATPIVSGTTYAVSVLTQPSSPTQICVVSNGAGTVASANVANISVTCTTSQFTLGGTVSGLAGTGLVLHNNGGENLAISSNGAFTFDTPIVSGAPYAVSVLTQPSSLPQTCVVTNAAGTVASANVTHVSVTCTTSHFTVGGTVSGLAGTGLVLRNNGGDDVAISANGVFNFTTSIVSGAPYAVTLLTQPSSPTQTCVVTNGNGTVGSANVTNVTVTCTTSQFTLGGTVSGLAGSGLVLQNSGGNNLAISANGAFTFITPIASGATYAVTVLTQPSSLTQTCVVTNGTGTVTSANITNVTVTCTTSQFTVGGTVSGLAGTGLVLRNNGSNNLAISASGVFSFTAPIVSGATYAVTVLTQPSSPTQTCVVTNGTGTVTSANITNVTVTCTSQFTVGGAVSGLAGTGLVLQNSGGNNLTISANGAFTFTTPIASGAAYAVTVLTQPSSLTQTCVVANGTGTVASANIASVTVTCTTSQFTVGGTISGLTASGLNLRNNGGTALAIAAGSTSFTFPATVASGAAYAVTVSQQPSSQTCTVSNGTGTVTNANVTGVSIVCPSGSSAYAFISNENGTPRVASYRVGANGGFTPVSALPVGAPATGVAVTSSGNHVIVAVDPSDSADGELRVYSVSSIGELAFVSSVPMGPGVGGYSHTVGCGPRPGNSGDISCGIGINSAPETVLIHPNGRFVYVMDGVAGGACDPPGVSPCSPPAGFPAAGNRVIVRYTFDPATGTLTYHDRHYVEGFVSFAMDPHGRFVWGTSYLERRIYEFRVDQSTGALIFGTGTFIGMSNGAMWLGIDPNGNYAYAAHSGDRTIDSYTINQTTGHLTNIGSVNGNCGAPGANCNKVTNVSVRGLAVSADGRTLYGASTSVFAYALGTDGSIGAALAGSPFAPSTPLNGGANRALVGIGSAGQYLYLQGYSEAATRVFSISPSTGTLTETAASPTSLAAGSGGTTALSLQ